MYDEIANLYHLIYPDWEAAVQKQAAALDRFLTEARGRSPLNVLDVSCGIGTQAIGLAERGHHVTAADVSVASVARARREAERRNLDIAFEVADMRECATISARKFDVVLSADNSVPHLLGDRDISVALQAFHDCLLPGGIVAVSIRDYPSMEEERVSPEFQVYGFRKQGADRYFVFQTRDWDGDMYDVTMYFVRQVREDQPAQVTTGRSRYYAITVDRLTTLLKSTGFRDVKRVDGVLHQPIVAGVRAAA